MCDHTALMQPALEVCRQGIAAGQSSFGAAIAHHSGKLICVAHNTVRATCDPAAHAEVNAIRLACQTLGTIDLSGHVLATTCEPCPMCAAAIHWARLDAVIYGAQIEDAARAGFNELSLACGELYRQGDSKVRVYRGVLRAECKALFDSWLHGPNATPY